MSVYVLCICYFVRGGGAEWIIQNGEEGTNADAFTSYATNIQQNMYIASNKHSLV